MTEAQSEHQPLSPREKARIVIAAALERKAERPVALDVSGLTSFSEVFVILGGRSDRQVRAIADAVVRALKQHGEAPLGVEGMDEGHWVLIDANDVVCHVFDEETRERYDLERLWSDATPIVFEEVAIAAEDGEPAS